MEQFGGCESGEKLDSRIEQIFSLGDYDNEAKEIFKGDWNNLSETEKEKFYGEYMDERNKEAV
jgi:hypothetical protein